MDPVSLLQSLHTPMFFCGFTNCTPGIETSLLSIDGLTALNKKYMHNET